MSRERKPVVAMLAVLLAACVDTTPIHVEQKPRPDSGADAPVSQECRDCIEGEGQPCRPVYDECMSLPDCPQFHACVLALGCYALSALEDRLACGQPCISSINLTSTHPAINAVIEMNDCTQTECRAACIIE